MPLRILYVHQYFRTPEEGGAIRSWYISRAMVKAGHRVVMVTSSNLGYRTQKDIEGIQVHYLPVNYDNSFGFVRRLWAFLLFAVETVNYVSGLGKFDLAYVTSTPLTVGLTALSLKRKKGLSYIFEVRDLWPEAPIQAGFIRSLLLKKIALNLENKIYREAGKLVALSPGIAESISDKNIKAPIHFCPNMSDCRFFREDETGEPLLLKKYRIQDDFVIGYFGALGKMNKLEYLLDIAKLAQTRSLKIKFLIIGNGSQKSRLQKIAAKSKLANTIFIDHIDKKELRKHLTLIHAAYISFAHIKVLESNSPNKFFDALASSKLIILNVNGWLRELVEQHHCGFYADPEKPEEFFEKLNPYISDPGLLETAGKKSRDLAENKFEREKLTAELLHFIEK